MELDHKKSASTQPRPFKGETPHLNLVHCCGTEELVLGLHGGHRTQTLSS